MKNWQFWGIISMLLVLNSNIGSVLDNNEIHAVSSIVAILVAAFATSLYIKEKVDKP